jgi:hypothetical protein
MRIQQKMHVGYQVQMGWDIGVLKGKIEDFHEKV